MNFTQRITDWLYHIRHRPRMLITQQNAIEISYEQFSTYFNGFIDGLGYSLNKNLGEKMRLWFKERYGLESLSMHVTNHILYLEETDEVKKEILLDNIELFFNEKLFPELSNKDN